MDHESIAKWLLLLSSESEDLTKDRLVKIELCSYAKGLKQQLKAWADNNQWSMKQPLILQQCSYYCLALLLPT